MIYEPTFTNTDSSGLRTDTNGFGDIDYQTPADKDLQSLDYRDSPLTRELDETPNEN